MNKLNLVLLVALMFSCFKLVGVSHEARQLFSAVDRAERQQKQLDAEYRRLDAERQTHATIEKVGQVARKRLHMNEPALTVYLDAPAVAALASPSTSGTSGTSGAPGHSGAWALPAAPTAHTSPPTRVAQTGASDQLAQVAR